MEQFPGGYVPMAIFGGSEESFDPRRPNKCLSLFFSSQDHLIASIEPRWWFNDLDPCNGFMK